MTIRFLVDECVIGPIASALADAGHDLAFVAGADAGLADSQVAARALDEDRILVTQDYDFGELTIRHGVVVPGVLLIGCDSLPPPQRVARVLAALAELGEPLEGHLTIVEPKRIRQRALQ